MVKDDTNVIPPHISSGFARRRNSILVGLTILTAVYYAVFVSLKDSTLLLAAEQLCTTAANADTTLPCVRSDMAGYSVSSGIMNIFMASVGFLAWHWNRRAHTALPPTPEGRLFGYLEEADRLNAGIFVFQTWDFVIAAFVISEHGTPIYLAHHLLTGLTSWFSLEYQFVHHYAIFFGGCSEISTIFLLVLDFHESFPHVFSTVAWWDTVIAVSQPTFVLCFAYYRVVGWWAVSHRLWSDVLYARKHDLIEQYRPGKGWFLYVFLIMDVLLGGLQCYWFFFEILPKVLEVLQTK